MYKMVQAENLKQKRTFQKWVVLIAPIFALFIADKLNGYEYGQMCAYNWWYVFLLPASLTLITSFIMKKDMNKNFHGLIGTIVDKKKIWYSKIIICTIYLGMMCMIFFIGITVMGLVWKNTINIKDSFISSTLLFILFSWQIPLWMYVSMKRNNGFTMLMSMIGNIIVAVFCAVESFWYIPFAIPSRIMCYTIGVLPNGLPVEAGTYILDMKVITIGIIISVVLYITISYISSKWFEKQEV